MNLNVDYDGLVVKVLGRDVLEVARQTFDALYKEADIGAVLDGYAGRYMGAGNESELYSPFRDFAEALFRATVSFHRYLCYAQTKELPSEAKVSDTLYVRETLLTFGKT